MADKKKQDSGTISQQRKAREEFLELKRMQSGETPAPPPPSAESVVPKTFREKSQNFWFYNRFTVIGVIFLAIVLTVGIKQCVSRKDYDLSIVLYSSTQITDKQTEKMSEYFAKYCEDINKDGEVLVNVLNCSYTDGGNRQVTQAIDTKLQAILVSEPEAMLFIVDDKTLERLDSIPATSPLFSDKGISLGKSFYSSTKNELGTPAPEGLRIIRRNISDTTMQNNKDAARCYKAAGKLLNKVTNENS
ncbi:MAG: hypothetical protein J5852_00950 [Clostridia bacterium]|nr:hypothetical protein [Clostridia bacterium]